MSVQELMYQSMSGETFFVMVDPRALSSFRKGDITAAECLEVYDIFKFYAGTSGRTMRPSKAELGAAFETSKVDEVIDFILMYGFMQKRANTKAPTKSTGSKKLAPQGKKEKRWTARTFLKRGKHSRP